MAVKFDISSIPAEAIVSKATLSLYSYKDIITDRTSYSTAFKFIRNWDDNKITWYYYDGVNDWDTYGGDYSPVKLDTVDYGMIFENKWAEFDVTSAVKSFVKDPSSNYGFIITETGTSTPNAHDGHYFRSSEYEDVNFRPKLTVEYVGEDLTVKRNRFHVNNSIDNMRVMNSCKIYNIRGELVSDTKIDNRFNSAVGVYILQSKYNNVNLFKSVGIFKSH